MKKSAQGFSAVEACIVIAILLVVAGGGYMIYRRGHATPATQHLSSGSVQPTHPGTTDDINNLSTADEQAETNADTTYSHNEQQEVQNTNNAAANIGSAYDESSL